MEICWNSEFWFLNCSFLVSETLDLVSEATETWFLKRLRLGFWIVQIWWLNRDLLRKREVRLKLTPLSLDLKYLRYSLEDLATCHMSKIFQNQRLSKSLNRGLNRGPNVLKNVSPCLTMSHHVSPECTSLVLLYPAWCSHALAQTPQQTRQSHSTPKFLSLLWVRNWTKSTTKINKATIMTWCAPTSFSLVSSLTLKLKAKPKGLRFLENLGKSPN
jgi:hypothetical protein